MSLYSFVEWLNNTSGSTYLRESDYPFAVIETVHILGLGLSVGVIMWLDLRLMGVAMRRERVSEVVEALEPWAIRGFFVMFVSGLLLLYSEPMKCYEALSFRLKALMLVLAGLNVLYFHLRVFPHVAEWDQAEVLPWRAKMVGFLSMLLWFGIIIAGRWTAYF